ncbi:MAG: hypothetical protein Q7S03_00070 [bacterium]|nr:hypothetical protein [bacterium]
MRKFLSLFNFRPPDFFMKLNERNKILVAVSSLTFLGISLVMAIVLLPNKEQVASVPAVPTLEPAKPSTPLTTAYGSQRHLFTTQDGFSVVLWLNKSKQVAASFSSDNGATWQDLTDPLVPGKVDNVAGVQDPNGDIHIAYETKGQIFYRKVGKDWSVSKEVPLDISGVAHRPSITLDTASNLPAAAWSFEVGMRQRLSRIAFLRAKADPTVLKNWCNAKGSSCGLPGYISVFGSTDGLGTVVARTTLHPVLVQMPKSADFYLFWSDASKAGSETLKLAVGKKEGNHWAWGDAKSQDSLGPETYRNYSVSSVVDTNKNQVLIAYSQKGDKTKVFAYKDKGDKEDLSPSETLGGQYSLTSSDKGSFLFYRKSDGKVGARQYTNSWSGELIETLSDGLYPQVSTGMAANRLPFVYTLQDGSVEKGALNL